MREKKLAIITIIAGVLFALFLVFLVPVNYGHLFNDDAILNGLFIAIPIILAIVFNTFIYIYFYFFIWIISISK